MTGPRIYRSPYPEVAVPEVGLADLVLGAAAGRGDRPALVDGVTGAVTTYAELVRAVDRLAAGLQRDGFQPGEVAAICAPNSPAFPVAFFAVARAGGATTTLNPAFTEAEMAKQLSDSGAVVAFATPELRERVEAAGGGRLRRVITFGAGLEAASADTAPARVDLDPATAVVALPYSSGTTGTPKGVMLTQRNLVAMVAEMEPVERTAEDDVVLATLPFFHIYGLVVILTLGLYRGATLVVFPRFELETVLEAIERHRITRLPLVPPLVLRLAQDPAVDAHDLSSVRTVISGAAPLAPELARAVSERLGGILVKQGYGMTELSPGATMHPEDRPADTSTVGVLHPNTEARIVDPATLEDVDGDQVGEIWIRGPQVMQGYLGRPEETAAILTDEGWLRTGDLGRFRADGELEVVDRLKELIKYKGFQVAPAELEALLIEHPAVADVAVVGRPDPEAGELPKAYIVLAPGAQATAEDLQAWAGERVVHYKRIREVEFVDAIPKSPSGKILRRVLVERERERAQAPR